MKESWVDERYPLAGIGGEYLDGTVDVEVGDRIIARHVTKTQAKYMCDAYNALHRELVRIALSFDDDSDHLGFRKFWDPETKWD